VEINIYTIQTAKEYSEKFAEWINRLDIYYDQNYLACDAEMQKGEFEIFTVSDGKDVFIYPYIKLKINNEGNKFDITSPYGYAGPFCSNKKLFNESEKVFNDYIFNSGCVTEFVRYHYLYNKEFQFSHNIQNHINREMVVMDMTEGWEKIWSNQYSVTNRNLIRKLEKEGYKVTFHDDTKHLNDFIDLYEDTMKNAGAENFYFFSRKYYFNLFEKLAGKIFLTRVIKDDHVYSSSLFFKSGGILTYYLSARDLKNYAIPSSNLMISETAKLGVLENQKVFNLGGGRSIIEDDALLKFKKNFYKHTTTFKIGKRIHNNAFYSELKHKYITDFGAKKYEERKNILQFYR